MVLFMAFVSLYAHLQDVMVEPGAYVRQRRMIGTVGKTGNARHPWMMPHLHLEVLSDGVPIDPTTLGLRVVEPPMSPHEERAALSAAVRQPGTSERDVSSATGGE